MAKPIISRISPFDADEKKVIKFSYSGSQPYGHHIIIKNAVSLKTVYEDEVYEPPYLEHTIPGEKIKNGYRYVVNISCYEKNGNNDYVESDFSDDTYFIALKTPEFYFSGDILKPPAVNHINMSSLQVSVIYDAEKTVGGLWDDLFEYKFIIYDSNKTEISSSNIMYDLTNMSYTYKGFENNTTYYIRCIGLTKYGMSVDTGYVNLFVSYEDVSSYSRLYATSDYRTGIVTYRTNFVMQTPIDENNVTLKNGYAYVENGNITYGDLGFGDFSVIAKVLNPHDTFLVFDGEYDNYSVSAVDIGDGKIVFKLTVPCGGINYMIYSKEFEFEQYTAYVIWVQKFGSLFSIDVFTEYDIANYNLWLTKVMPYGAVTYDYWFDLDKDMVKIDKNDLSIKYQSEEPDNAKLYDIWIDKPEEI